MVGDSDLAKRMRNLTLSEDQLDQDYELYADLLPGHLQRQHKVHRKIKAQILGPPNPETKGEKNTFL